MTVFVTSPRKSGTGMLKPQRVNHPYNVDNLEHLMQQHPDAIYFTDDETGFESLPVPMDTIKMLLASRIMVASTAVENLRERKATTTMHTIETGVHIAENIAVMQELERVWEALVGTPPNALETRQWAVQANLSSEV